LLLDLYWRSGSDGFSAKRVYLDALAAHNLQMPVLRRAWKNALYRRLRGLQERHGEKRGSWRDDTGRIAATATCCHALSLLWLE
jgi:hypothetical protein